MPTKLYKKTNPHTNGFPEIGYDAMGDDDCYAGWHDAMPQIDMVKAAATPRNFFGAMSSRSILEIGEWYQWKDPKFKRLTLEEVGDMTSWFQRHYDLHEYNHISVDVFPNHRSHIGPHFDKVTRMDDSKVQVINVPLRTHFELGGNTGTFQYNLAMVEHPCCEYTFIDKEKTETAVPIHYYDMIEWDSREHRTWCIKNASTTLQPRIQFMFRKLMVKKVNQVPMPPKKNETDEERRERLAAFLPKKKKAPVPEFLPSTDDEAGAKGTDGDEEEATTPPPEPKKKTKKITKKDKTLISCASCHTTMPRHPCFTDDPDGATCNDCYGSESD